MDSGSIARIAYEAIDDKLPEVPSLSRQVVNEIRTHNINYFNTYVYLFSRTTPGINWIYPQSDDGLDHNLVVGLSTPAGISWIYYDGLDGSGHSRYIVQGIPQVSIHYYSHLPLSEEDIDDVPRKQTQHIQYDGGNRTLFFPIGLVEIAHRLHRVDQWARSKMIEN